MSKKGVELPITFIIFLIVLIIIFALVLMWNFSGFDFFKGTTDQVNNQIIKNISNGKLSLG